MNQWGVTSGVFRGLYSCHIGGRSRKEPKGEMMDDKGTLKSRRWAMVMGYI